MSNLDLKKIIGNDTLTFENVQKLYEQMKKKEELSEYTFPSKPSSDGYYHMYIKDDRKKSGRRQIKSKTLDKLIDRVYNMKYPEKTFKEVFELVEENRLQHTRNQEKLLSIKNSIQVHQSTYKRYFDGTEFENKAVREISTTDLDNLFASTFERIDMCKKAFMAMRGIIKSILDYSYENRWVDENVYHRMNFKKYNDMLKPTKPISMRIHSDRDVERMLEYIHEYQQKKPTYVPSYALELQILAGLRRGEVAPLEWSDITNDYIWIHKEQLTLKEKGKKEEFRIVQHTKTYVDRSFPITKDIKDLLNRLRVVNRTYFDNSVFLFPDDKNINGVINNNVVYHFYSRMCKKLNIEISREFLKGPHSFRRNGITKVANSPNGNMVIASTLYGNSVLSASNNYYAGVSNELAKKILDEP